MSKDTHPWWDSLKHGGMLIAPSRLSDLFPGQAEPLDWHTAQRLRRELTRLDGGAESQRSFMQLVLDKVCGLNGSARGAWYSGSNVDARWSKRAVTGEIVKPRRIWQGPRGAVLPVFVDPEKRLGIGRGRRAVSRVVEWLRTADQKVALLTNFRQWRLIYAGLDHDAWAEWDTDLWFEEGQPGRQVDALRLLLSPDALVPPDDGKPGKLLLAIEETRKGQAELSQALGERVRRAVEELIRAYGPLLENREREFTHRDVYIAACRVIMRLVVLFFAESRDLLPRDNPIYHHSYGVQGLREYLQQTGAGSGAERLRHRQSAWARLLGLFQLVYHGSHHPDFEVHRYGGGLFQAGDPQSDDRVRRAVAVFESLEHAPSDKTVYEILQLLSFSPVKIRQGRASTWILAPVDFSDLSTEYIGILYEGLLDFELRQAGDEPVVFLNVGDQPALPLARLEQMDEKALKSLLEKFKSSTKDSGGEELEAEDADAEEEASEESGKEAPEAEDEADETETDDLRQAARRRARAWATAAVEAARLVRRPRDREARARYQDDVAAAAKKLIFRLILPGEWYLVRWGGTRKGSGTFYTRPGLAVPTVHRTLRPLAYVPPKGKGGKPNEDAPPTEWFPRKPEEIIALKTCDTAMGSGSFLLAALRFLSDALYASLHVHGWLARGESGRIEAPVIEGRPAWFQDLISGLPPEAERAEPFIRARLKRWVVERCIYGVDIDPLAVELARLALWIETMDRELPFEFLDHKLKVGNALVGCWFDNFRDYPIMGVLSKVVDEREGKCGVSLVFIQGTKPNRGRRIRHMDQDTTARLDPLIIQSGCCDRDSSRRGAALVGRSLGGGSGRTPAPFRGSSRCAGPPLRRAQRPFARAHDTDGHRRGADSAAARG